MIGDSTEGKLETFQSHVDMIDPRTPGAASAAPIGNPDNTDSTVLAYVVPLDGKSR